MPTTTATELAQLGGVITVDSGNVGLGVTPSAWGTSEYKAIQVGIGGSISGRVSSGDQDKVNVAANVYNDGSVFKYIASDDATIYQQTNGIHIFSNATSGTSGNTATFTERLRIASSGQIGIGGANYGTSGQVLTSGGASAAPSWQTSPVGFRNRIINGDMRIWQRGTTISDPTTTSNFYTADRWGVNRGSDLAGVTVSRDISGLSGFQYCLKLQRTAGNTSTQAIALWGSNESSNTVDLAGGQVTLSFWARAGSNYSGGALVSQVISGTGTDQRVYAYTGLTAIASATITLTTTWTRYTMTGTAGSSVTEVGEFLQWTPTGTAGADDSVYITGVQLEAGSTATEFERRPYGTELALCQRYFQSYGGVSAADNICMGASLNTTTCVGFVQLPVSMRTSPSIGFTSVNAVVLDDNGAAVISNNILTNTSGTTSVYLSIPSTTTAGLTANRPARMSVNGINARVTWSAEL